MGRHYDIKVCGNRHNIAEVDGCRPDFLGVIFHPASPRHFDAESIPDEIVTPRVAVFVNASVERIVEQAQKVGAKIVQLHGNETPDDCSAVAARGFEVWKAAAIAGADSFEALKAYRGSVARFLFDTRCEGHGGSGRQFDWRLIDAYTLDVPFMLAGGIAEADATRLLEIGHPMLAGFDINSRFEISPGRKDIQTIKNFISKIRRT